MGLGGVLGDEHIRRHGEDNAVGAFGLAELRELDAGLGGQGRGAEEDRNGLETAGGAILHVREDGADDQLLFLEGQQRDLAGGTENEQLARAVFDLAGDQELKALDVDLVVCGERGGHGHPRALEIHHKSISSLSKMWLMYAKGESPCLLQRKKGKISFPA